MSKPFWVELLILELFIYYYIDINIGVYATATLIIAVFIVLSLRFAQYLCFASCGFVGECWYFCIYTNQSNCSTLKYVLPSIELRSTVLCRPSKYVLSSVFWSFELCIAIHWTTYCCPLLHVLPSFELRVVVHQTTFYVPLNDQSLLQSIKLFVICYRSPYRLLPSSEVRIVVHWTTYCCPPPPPSPSAPPWPTISIAGLPLYQLPARV